MRVVAGEPRVRYLHTEPGAADDVLAAWRALAGHAAWVGTRERGGGHRLVRPGGRGLRRRIGDVVVVCRDD